ncbi:NAD-dependent malic enzyme [Candidatus Roizmanbacteria bacterium CG_4_10_14_0_8_um_filter_39_9]|uniref:NAD-dependent malic enzyme n=1 Tax=Candidatus Roizmanbacteria bacterium CG_4_10_14_0_8_um_filter_39_9 TaxID=1974829 RepID=A0A2M7QD64_9BACT|nr:MAG: NAD-dependent malic enzyme [Candidatus Roizmanbacteria bacterium CG_4_10_14_0_8_um_filter_39_9]
MTNLNQDSFDLHKQNKGKIQIESRISVKNKYDLSLVYTPGVAEPCRRIAKDHSLSFDLTWRGRTVAVISDGSAVLGLGNIGPDAALPVMEGKALLMKQFGGVDSVPIVINTQDPFEIIHFVKNIAPSFAGINLEDISAPRCFQIEEELQDIGIPVFHDDQHGTAIVVSAALQNAAKIVGKPYESLNVVVVGAGAAGLAISRMLLGLQCLVDTCSMIPGHKRVKNVIVVDRKGALYSGRENQNIYKEGIASISNIEKRQGTLSKVIVGADAVIGVSGPDAISKEMIQSMAQKSIVFALANPMPEIMPEDAKSAGAYIVASGRSDFANQINNVLAFPGIFQAVIRGRINNITPQMKQIASQTLADLVEKPNVENIIPDPFFPHLADRIADAILKEAI